MTKSVIVACLICLWAIAGLANDSPRLYCQNDPQYDPVCARSKRLNIVITYSNSCMAKQDGAEVIDRGGPSEFDDKLKRKPYKDGNACPKVQCDTNYVPVCARTPKLDEKGTIIGFENKVYFNECAAIGLGVGSAVFKKYSEDVRRGRWPYDNFSRFCVQEEKDCPNVLKLVCAHKLSNDKDQKPETEVRLFRNACVAMVNGAVWSSDPINGVCK